MIRVQAIFSDEHETIGASETYLLFTPTTIEQWVGAPPGVAGTGLDTFIGNRRALLAGGFAGGGGAAFLVKVRVSIPGNFRTSFVWNVPSGGQIGNWPSVGNTSNSVEAWTRLLIDLPCGPGPHGRLFLFGAPETLLVSPNGYRADSLWNARWIVFANGLAQVGWSIPRRRSASTPPLPLPITSFVTGGDNRSALVQPLNIGTGGVTPPPTGQVIIRGRKPSEWNGVHKYAIVGGGTPTLLLGPTRGPLFDFEPEPGVAGTIQLWGGDASAVSVDQAKPQRFVSHRTGDPFVLYRGRRRRSLA